MWRESDLESTQLHAWEKIKKDLPWKNDNLFHKDAIVRPAKISLLERERNHRQPLKLKETQLRAKPHLPTYHNTQQKEQHGGADATGAWKHAPAQVLVCVNWPNNEQKQHNTKVGNILLPPLLRIMLTYISLWIGFIKPFSILISLMECFK